MDLGQVIYTDEESFWDRVEKAGDDECWLWKGGFMAGYGVLRFKSKNKRKAHRISWSLSGRTLAKGKSLHHKCGVKACVNPNHLQPLSIFDHMALHASEKKKFAQGLDNSPRV
jgi:hypothetical protein